MNKKILFLITHKFPYQPPMEQYLLEELDIIKEYFDEIFLVPSSREINTTCINDISEDIKIIKLQRKAKHLEFSMAMFKNVLFNINFYKEIIKLVSKKLLFNNTAIKNLIITYIYNDSVSTKIVREIDMLDLDFNDNIVVYSYWLSHYISIGINVKLKLKNRGFKKIKCISRAHGSSDVFISKKMQNYKIDLDTINEQVDRIYSVSEMGANYLKEIGILKEIIEINRLGVKVGEDFASQDLSLKTFNIVSCSNVVEVKRLHLILESLKLICDLNINWVHFGDGPLLTELIKQSEIKPSNLTISFYGKKSNKFIMEYYKKDTPHLFINVSAVEGVPVSIMEAISFGIPVIATDVGGTREVCVDNYNGILLQKDFKISELAEGIERFNKMSLSEYNKFRANSYSLYQSRFNSNKNYSIFAKNILSLMEGDTNS